MDGEKEEKILNFCSVTGADAHRAKYFLEASEWDTTMAVSMFFEGEGSDESTDESEMSAVQPQLAKPQPMPSSSSKPTSRVQTFSSWGSKPKASDDSDEEEGQAFYAGGSLESGQQILGPSKKKKDGGIVEDLFQSAKQHGATVVSARDRESEKQKPSTFVGAGYRLGESVSEPSQSVPGASRPPESVTVTLKLWKSGFTVNDGELRLYEDPKNKQFLQSIQRGEIPLELMHVTRGVQAALDMEDHRDEDYQPPKQARIADAFTGQGQTLGASTSSSSQPQENSRITSSAAKQVVVDEGSPVTNIQIRLSDGSRLVARFNHTHTVGDVRRHIVANRPQYIGVAFCLATTLPNRTLTDDSVTIAQADLLNAVIIQKPL